MSLLHLVLESTIRILVDRDILKHPLQLARVLESTRVLQFTNHRGFCIVRSRSFTNESVRQHFRVELLEHVFVFDVFEDCHLHSGIISKD